MILFAFSSLCYYMYIKVDNQEAIIKCFTFIIPAVVLLYMYMYCCFDHTEINP